MRSEIELPGWFSQLVSSLLTSLLAGVCLSSLALAFLVLFFCHSLFLSRLLLISLCKLLSPVALERVFLIIIITGDPCPPSLNLFYLLSQQLSSFAICHCSGIIIFLSISQSR